MSIADCALELPIDNVADDTASPAKLWFGLALITLPGLVVSMDMTVLNLAVPRLAAALSPTSTQLLWIVDIYGFVLAGLLVTMGALGDRVGRRRLLMFGAGLFAVASLLCATATSAVELIAARALLGVAGATLAPSTLSLIANMFPDDRRRTAAIAVWSSGFTFGAAAGPLVGGALLQRFWWGSVFMPAVVVMAMVVAMGTRLLPEFRDPAATRLDSTSAALSLVAVLAIVEGLKLAAQGGARAFVVACFVVGIVAARRFVRRQNHLLEPLIDLSLFRVSAFRTSVIANMSGAFMGFGGMFFLAQYVQLVRGQSPLRAGLWATPWAAGAVVGGLATTWLARHVARRTIVVRGFTLAAAGFVILSRIGPNTSLAVLAVGSIVVTLGLTPAVIAGIDLIMGSVAPGRAGAASAIDQTGGELGGALGVALLGSLGAAIYRSHMTARVLDGLSPVAARAAHGTLGGAAEAIRHLSAHDGDVLLAGARDAFTRGLDVAALACAFLAVIVALAVRHTSRP